MSSNQLLKISFKTALSLWASTVHVITTRGDAGFYGFTATSVCSVTDEPPTLLVCINKVSGRDTFFSNNRTLRINTLRTGDSVLANRFAGRTGVGGEYRFSETQGWDMNAAFGPRWENALAAFGCVLEEIHNVGTHAILIARVVEITHAESDTAPLVYAQRRYVE